MSGKEPPWRPPGPALDSRVIHETVRARLFSRDRPASVRLGRFTVIRKLGEGGMGQVFLAYDEALDRRVAVKLLHPWRADERGRARFAREAQALARLSHPHVVQVHEVGTHEGATFVAMEYVTGTTLRTWLRTPRAWTERLEILLQCGRGLQSAHEVGLVHRDFKPANVIVGDDGRARVLDFGLARELGGATYEAERGGDEPGTEDDSRPRGSLELLTTAGTVLGTPAYMAPEQLRGEPCDGRSDQFSLCVVAFEALFGTRPFAGASLPALQANVLAGRIASADDAAVPRSVRQAIERGLAVEPERRWPDMAALLDALELGLRGRPRPARIAALVGSAAVLALPLLPTPRAVADPCAIEASALVGTWDAARREQLSTALAKPELGVSGALRSTIVARLDAWASRWVDAQQAACVATHVEHVQPQAVLEARRACLEHARRELDVLVQMWTHADVELAQGSARLLAHLPALGICADPLTDAPGADEVDDPELAAAIGDARVELRRARVQQIAGTLDEDALDSLGARLRRLDHAPLSLELASLRGELALSHQRFDEGTDLVLDAAHEAKRLGLRELEADMRVRLARAIAAEWSKPELEAMVLAEAEASVSTLAHRDDARRIDLLEAEGFLQLHGGQYEAGAATMRRARELAARLDEDRAEQTRADLAVALLELGQPQRALVELQAALPSALHRFGERSAWVASIEHDLGLAHLQGQDHAQAQQHLRRALALRGELLGEDSVAYADTLYTLADSAAQTGELESAIEMLRTALATYERVLGSDHVTTGEGYNALGVLLFWRGDFAGSMAAYERAEPIYARAYGPDHHQYGLLRSNLGESLTQQGEHARALGAYAQAIEIFARVLPPTHPDRALPHKGRGLSLLALGRYEDAIASFQRALDIHASNPPDALELADLRFGLARALRAAKREPDRARELARAAHETFDRLGLSERADEIERWRDSTSSARK